MLTHRRRRRPAGAAVPGGACALAARIGLLALLALFPPPLCASDIPHARPAAEAAAPGAAAAPADQVDPALLPADRAGADAAPALPAPAPPDDDANLLGNHGRGFLAMRDQFPFAMAHLNPFPETTRVLAPGRHRVGMTLDWSNTFGFRTNRHLIDGEMVSLVFAGAWSPLERLEVGAEVPVHFRTGGVYDSFIESFHDTFGFSNSGRARNLQNTWQIRIPNREGLIYESNEEDPVLSNPVLKAKVQLTAGDDLIPAAAAQFLVKLPFTTDNEVLGSNGFDAALQLAASKHIWHGLFAHTNLWYGEFSDVGLEHLRFSRQRFGARIGLEYAVSSDISVLTHLEYLTMIFQDLPTHLSNYSVLLTLGMKYDVTPDAQFELGLLENLYRYDNSADFGVHLGFGLGF